MIIKKSSAALVLLLAVACASTPVAPSSGSAGPSSAPGLPSVADAPDYILLSAPNQIRSWNFSNSTGVKGLYVRGVVTDYGFRPVGEVLGNGKFCADGQDLLSLTDLTVHKAADGKTPKAPYIVGCAAGGVFQPASRTIVTQ